MPLDRHAAREGASGSSPGARRPPSDRRHTRPSRKRGWLHEEHRPGLLAGLVATAVLAAPALAAPANVTVRVEGADATLVPRTAVPPTRPPRRSQGRPTDLHRHERRRRARPGDRRATGRHVAAGFGYLLERDQGRDALHRSPPTRRLLVVLGQLHGYATRALRQSSCRRATTCSSRRTATRDRPPARASPPLRLTGVPRDGRAGRAVTVKRRGVRRRRPPRASTTRHARPAEGVTRHRGGATATTGADGTATLAFASAGPAPCTATKPGRVRTAGATCVTAGNDGTCGTQVPPGTPPAPSTPADTTAPVATFAGLRERQGSPAARRPRELRGTVTADPSGPEVASGSASPARTGGAAGRSTAAQERFERHRCGGSKSFRIGDRADWSLPAAEAAAQGPLHHPRGRRSTTPATSARDRDGDPGPVRARARPDPRGRRRWRRPPPRRRAARST